MNRIFKTIKLGTLCYLGIGFTSPHQAHAEQNIHHILEKYCYDCHDSDVQKGNFQLDELNKTISNGLDGDNWKLVLDQLNLDEMPPKKKKQPSESERKQLIQTITESLRIAAEQKRKDVHITLRRLTKQQYTNSLKDLLHLDLDFGKPLPTERLSEQGFKNNGEEQTISLLQTEYYQSIAEKALAKAVQTRPEMSYNYTFQFGEGINQQKLKRNKRKVGAKEIPVDKNNFIVQTTQNKNVLDPNSNYQKNDFRKNCFADLRGSNKKRFRISKEGMVLDPSQPHAETYEGHAAFLSPSPNLQLHIKQFPTEGNFILKVKVAKLKASKSKAYVNAFLGERLDWGTDSKMFSLPIEITTEADQFQTIEFKGRLENFPIPTFDPRHKDPLSTLVVGIINDSGNHKNGSSIVVKSIELQIEPKEFWPSESHRSIFISSPNQNNESLYSKEILQAFMGKAYRRPASSKELEEMHQLWKAIRPTSNSFTTSIQDTLLAILCSPKFLYMIEEKQSKEDGLITDLELATRISYFLWNSMPDRELIDLAKDNKLKDQLHTQVNRMLNDEKSMQFIQAFTSQWLQIDKMVHVKMNAKKYRNFNRYIREDMIKETQYFFAEVLHQNLSLDHFINANFSILNQNLAQYYGIKDVEGSFFRKVPLTQNPERRGLMSHGLFLSGNSDGEVGNPIKRGVWLISRLLNDPPPEPPPNVPEIDPGDPEFAKLTLKEQLIKHRESPSCYDCHQKIDPWGLVFDNYDASGIWKNKKSDPITLSNGLKVSSPTDLKNYLATEKTEQFAKAITSYLLSYALGRSLSYVDDPAIETIVDRSKKDHYRFKDLIKHITNSSIFLQK